MQTPTPHELTYHDEGRAPSRPYSSRRSALMRGPLSGVALVRSLGAFALLFTSLTTSIWAQPRAFHISQIESGLWVPVRGELGRAPLQWLMSSGDEALYALGAGRVFRGARAQQESTQGALSWEVVGQYSPELSWDEGEGVSASGPFSSELLSRVERAVSAMLEEQLETQGDEDWLTEDTVNALLESYEREEDPPLDSPYRVSGLYPNQAGVWIATGAGLWGTNEGALVPIGGSPSEVRSVTQAYGKLWVGTSEALWSWSGQLGEPWERRADERALGGASLTTYQGELWLLSANKLYRLPSPEGELVTEYASQDGLIDLFEGGGRLWLLTTRQLWVREGATWRACQRYETSPTHARWSEGHLIAVAPHQLWIGDERCEPPLRLGKPSLSELGLRDALLHQGALYVATTQGLFAWRTLSQESSSEANIAYLKRALEPLPNFAQLYEAALEASSLDRASSSFGLRPVLSALLPEVRAQLWTHPSRVDEVPTFSQGNRQLTLLQPRPQFQVMVQWNLSFDFLARLFNPELSSAYGEVQSQLDLAQEQPGADLALETELGLPEDWSDDTYTTQAQRLAATTVALQRRQAHRDRVALRAQLQRLYREWLDLIYRLWLAPPPPQSDEAIDDQLRLEELTALLNALTNHRYLLTPPRP